mmetsp:Transcript_43130/g.101307  ORF Transcript_43130/g.101307 Transcript_43130/m.101307 type:complete len:391 (-) Transcript_43130:295-1467(-)
MAALEVIPPALSPTERVVVRVHAIVHQLVNNHWHTTLSATPRLELRLELATRQERPEWSQRPLLLGVEATLSRLLAPVVALHPAFKTRASVTKLEHQALRETGKVNGVGIRHIVEGRVKPLLWRNGHGHVSIHQALCVHQRACNHEHINVVALVVVGVLQVQDQHEHKWMVRCGGNHRVSQNRVRFVLGVRLIGNCKAGRLCHLENGVERLVVNRNHIRIDIKTSMVPEDLQAQNVSLALPHLLLTVHLLIEHGQLRDKLVVPEREAPVRVGCEVVYTESVNPHAGWLLRANPNHVNHLGDVRRPLEGLLHVRLAALAPSVFVGHFALTAVPVVELSNVAHFHWRKFCQDTLKVRGAQLPQHWFLLCHILATQKRPAGPLVHHVTGCATS